jgi:hypothetical protein
MLGWRVAVQVIERGGADPQARASARYESRDRARSRRLIADRQLQDRAEVGLEVFEDFFDGDELDVVLLVLRRNLMIQAIRARPRQVTASSQEAVDHLFESEH